MSRVGEILLLVGVGSLAVAAFLIAGQLARLARGFERERRFRHVRWRQHEAAAAAPQSPEAGPGGRPAGDGR
jgi:hypothetical protein